jgi:hypothetical protein
MVVKALESIFPLNDMDSFTVSIDFDSLSRDVSPAASMLNYMLHAMSFVKTVTIDMDSKFRSMLRPGDFFPQVRHLTLRSCNILNMDLFQTFVSSFPGIQTLQTFNYCGTWNEEISQFQFVLEDGLLEKLMVDLTPAVEKICEISCDGFIVIQVKQLFYKLVPSNLSNIIKIDIANLQGLKCDRDFVFVHISVENVNHLGVFRRRKKAYTGKIYNRWDSDEILQLTTVF